MEGRSQKLDPFDKDNSQKNSSTAPAQIEDLKKTPAPQKTPSTLPLKVLAIIPIIVLAVGFYIIYPRKIGPKLPFSQLDSKVYQKLDQSLKAKVPVRELILSKDSRELWLAISRTGNHIAQLNLKSVKGSILSEREIVLNSKSDLSNNWARFYTFDLEKGTKIIPGFYNYEIRLIPNDSKKGLNYFISKVAPFFSAPKTEETFSGTILFSPDNRETFHKKLAEYKIKVKDAYERPIKEKMERWEAYLSIVNKIEIMLQDEIKPLKNGSEIVKFEKKYTEFLGPMLSQIVVDAKNMAKELAETSQEKSLENEKIFLFGKEIGETTSSLVLEIKKIKKFTDLDRSTYSNKVSDSFEILRKNVEMEISKIQNEFTSIPN